MISLIPKFNLDYCFDKLQTTVALYENLIKRIAISSLNGINGKI